MSRKKLRKSDLSLGDECPPDMPAIICDTGYSSIKSGWSGSVDPRYTYSFFSGDLNGLCSSFSQSIKRVLGLPDEFNSPRGLSLVVGCPILLPSHIRNGFVEYLFETLEVSRLCLRLQASFSLNAISKMSGLVIDCGHTHTQVVPIIDGFDVSRNMLKFDLAGKDVTRHLFDLVSVNNLPHLLRPSNITNKRITLSSSSLSIPAREIKEMKGVCFVAPSREEYSRLYTRARYHLGMNRKTYVLPDGSELFLNEEVFAAPEILFDGKLASNDLDDGGIGRAVLNSLESCPMDDRTFLRESVVLCGGSSLFTGFLERLKSEVQGIKQIEGTVREGKERSLSFLGASIIGELWHGVRTDNQWLKRETYRERGSCHLV